ncbi:protein serine/threonine phosphatase PrpC, regulation of stationary phase [Leptospira ryugenii]|uniref:Protein serine/threonine phosphatase PrpC, regulation of stationary phase n=1 Tax=Leptospira ryugenii TaxID=1917863 RepID=A0A2P2E1W4_9LEPT|nr:protein phosphatase 2C domain-containing protein [Leptospira ryugenii]GBF50903.1 protein serine/threonine phosphatase PrpC, regulation of stationary phase [Leptospira ryugenii]
MKVSIYSKCDVGKVRLINEDNYLILKGKLFEYAQAEKKLSWIDQVFRTEGIFLAAIDGMGGLQGGQVASQSIATHIAEHWHEIKEGKTSQIPVTALLGANQNLKRLAEGNHDLAKMGAVVTCCYLSGGSAHCAQVGDSRLYLLRDQELVQMSEDQTFVSNLVRLGKITPKEAESHPKRNVVSQALSPSGQIKPVDFKFKIQAKDKILLCSDGLHGLIGNKEIQNILLQYNGFDCVEALVDAANANGGKDNITVLLAEISAKK